MDFSSRQFAPRLNVELAFEMSALRDENKRMRAENLRLRNQLYDQEVMRDYFRESSSSFSSFASSAAGERDDRQSVKSPTASSLNSGADAVSVCSPPSSECESESGSDFRGSHNSVRPSTSRFYEDDDEAERSSLLNSSLNSFMASRLRPMASIDFDDSSTFVALDNDQCLESALDELRDDNQELFETACSETCSSVVTASRPSTSTARLISRPWSMTSIDSLDLIRSQRNKRRQNAAQLEPQSQQSLESPKSCEKKFDSENWRIFPRVTFRVNAEDAPEAAAKCADALEAAVALEAATKRADALEAENSRLRDALVHCAIEHTQIRSTLKDLCEVKRAESTTTRKLGETLANLAADQRQLERRIRGAQATRDAENRSLIEKLKKMSRKNRREKESFIEVLETFLEKMAQTMNATNNKKESLSESSDSNTSDISSNASSDSVSSSSRWTTMDERQANGTKSLQTTAAPPKNMDLL